MRLPVIVLLASALLCRADDSPAGRWEGSAQIPGRELALIVDLAPGNGEMWVGSITIPELNLKGAVLNEVTLNGSEISFSLKTALADQRNGPAKFHGNLSADGRLTGEFVQAGNSAPFAMQKVGPPQIEGARRSTAIAQELEGEWKGGYELFGYPRKVTIILQNRGAEGATAEFVIVGKKENKLPVDLVTQEGDFVSIDSHETGLSFEGRLKQSEIKGTVFQGPLEIPVVLRRQP